MIHASWIHGNAVKSQREDYSLSTQYTGWGAVIQSHGVVWFHFTVPTPVIVNGQDTKVQKVFVLFSTGGTAKVTKVHIWDGPNLVQAYDTLSVCSISPDQA